MYNFRDSFDYALWRITMTTLQPSDNILLSPTEVANEKSFRWQKLLRSRQVWIGVLAALLILAAALFSSASLDLILPTGIILMAALAYANGANDVSKAIATLVGSGVANYRRAI